MNCKPTSFGVRPWPDTPYLGIYAVTESSEPATLAQVTAEIVSAYVSNNKIAPSDLAMLISDVAGSMAKIGTSVELPAVEKPEPAVSVRRSIRPDHLVCLVCGKPQKMLKRHLAIRHELTPAGYRERFGLKADYPMTAPNYAQQRREVALASGLGRPKERRARKSTARPKAPKSRQSATTKAGS
jgi:predicted transcriptional regulator